MLLEDKLFDAPVTLTDWWRTEGNRVSPMSTVNDNSLNGDITFNIAPSLHGLISLADMAWKLERRIKRVGDDCSLVNVTVDDDVAPVNNFLPSLFSTVQFSLGGKPISGLKTHYLYRAMSETLLGFSRGAMESQLTSALFYEEEPGKLEDVAIEGEMARKEFCMDTKSIPLSGELLVDFLQQDKSLITGVSVELKLSMTRPEFSLKCNDSGVHFNNEKSHVVCVRTVKFHFKRFVPSPDYMTAVAAVHETETVNYHVERVIMRAKDITQTTQVTNATNLATGQLPKAVVTGFVDNAAFAVSDKLYEINHHRQVISDVCGI